MFYYLSDFFLCATKAVPDSPETRRITPGMAPRVNPVGISPPLWLSKSTVLSAVMLPWVSPVAVEA